eukprot:m.694586 g.694586  ORF g.694586 m.694586 type:complete len:240 (+) comp22882_c0_seq16:1110-1829(+)
MRSRAISFIIHCTDRLRCSSIIISRMSNSVHNWESNREHLKIFWMGPSVKNATPLQTGKWSHPSMARSVQRTHDFHWIATKQLTYWIGKMYQPIKVPMEWRFVIAVTDVMSFVSRAMAVSLRAMRTAASAGSELAPCASPLVFVACSSATLLVRSSTSPDIAVRRATLCARGVVQSAARGAPALCEQTDACCRGAGTDSAAADVACNGRAPVMMKFRSDKISASREQCTWETPSQTCSR